MRQGWEKGALVTGLVLAVGCQGTPPSGPFPKANEHLVTAPVQRALDLVAATAQAGAATTVGPAIDHSPDVTPVPVSNPTIDAKVLVITADGTDTAFAAITGTLSRLGTPYDVLNATTGPALTAATLSDGASHGHYEAIILDRGTLLVTSTTGLSQSAFTNDEWSILTTYEAAFGVRRVVFYGVPDAEYGFGTPTGVDGSTTPVPATCTEDGAEVFSTANCASPIPLQAYVYEAAPLDSQTVPLLTDAAGHALAATRKYPSGREALVMTFSQSDTLNHTLELAYGAIHWGTRGVFMGERHAYFGAQIDDLFLASDIFTGGTLRITDADLQNFYNHEQTARANPVTADVRFDFCVNTAGTSATDPLTSKAVALKSAFKWISHTYDHMELDAATATQMTDELSQNDIIINQLELQPYSKVNLVTPSITGLNNAPVMQAAAAFGVKYLVSDTSVAGYNTTPYNEGLWNPSAPSILMIGRHPTNLFYNVATPDEWVAEYNSLYATYWGRNLTYQEILDEESNTLLGYLLHWESNPWMFHQANTFNYDGAGHSLLSDLIELTFSKYEALSKLPFASPTMDVLGQRVASRMLIDAGGVSATIQPGQTMTISATKAVTVGVTGACGPGAESYAGDWISYVDVPAGGSATVPLNGCAAGGHDAGTSGDDGGVSVTTGAVSADGGAPDASQPLVAESGGGCGCSMGEFSGARAARNALGAGALLLLLLLIGRNRNPRSRDRRNH